MAPVLRSSIERVVFDARGDVLEIALDGIGHLMLAPREILLEETERGLVALEIVGADDTGATLRLRDAAPKAKRRRSRAERCDSSCGSREQR